MSKFYEETTSFRLSVEQKDGYRLEKWEMYLFSYLSMVM